jgi:hypothetical protein
MLECPSCHKEAKVLVIPEGGKLGCNECVVRGPKKYNVHLGQTWASDGKTRLTHGKAWEIGNRVVSPDDGKTLINKKTGKPAQY